MNASLVKAENLVGDSKYGRRDKLLNTSVFVFVFEYGANMCDERCDKSIGVMKVL